MRWPWLILMMVALPLTGYGEEPKSSTLTVNGAGHVALPPDTAFVTIGVETVHASLAEAHRGNSAVMQKVATRLQALQISKDHIQTASFTVTPQYKPLPRRTNDSPAPAPEILAYTVSNTLTIQIDRLDTIGQILDESLGAGANRFVGLHWAVRDEHQAKLRALQQAASDAYEKAQALSTTLHVKLVRLQSAHESSQVVRPMALSAARSMADISSSEPPMFGGEVRVEANVTLVYEVGP